MYFNTLVSVWGNSFCVQKIIIITENNRPKIHKYRVNTIIFLHNLQPTYGYDWAGGAKNYFSTIPSFKGSTIWLEKYISQKDNQLQMVAS